MKLQIMSLNRAQEIALDRIGYTETEIERFLSLVSPVIGLGDKWTIHTEGEETLTIFIRKNGLESQEPVVVKIFPSTISSEDIWEYTNRWDILEEARVNVPKREDFSISNSQLNTFNGVFHERNQRNPVNAIIYQSLGPVLREVPITRRMIQSAADQIANIHSICTSVDESSDTWGVSNLMSRTREALDLFNASPDASMTHQINADTWDQIATFVDDVLVQFPQSRLTRGVIHGDLSSGNVTVSESDGQVGIHDFGTFGEGALVIDLSSFLATGVMTMPIGYALPNPSARKSPEQLFLALMRSYTYAAQKHGHDQLTEVDFLAVPVYMQAAYASYWVNGALAAVENPQKGSSNAYSNFLHDGYYGFHAMQHWCEPLQDLGMQLLDQLDYGYEL